MKTSNPQQQTIEQVFAYGADTLSDVDKPDREQAYENQKKNGIDQALSDMSKIIDEAKPEYESQNGRKHRYFGNDHKNGFRLGARQYQSNLKERLK